MNTHKTNSSPTPKGSHPSAQGCAPRATLGSPVAVSPRPVGAPLSNIALSIRQPWAWLILHAGKNIENREWRRDISGHCLIHAAKTLTRGDYDACTLFLSATPGLQQFRDILPALRDLPRGGIVGQVKIDGCITQSDSPWFCGPYGFQLSEPEPLPFFPLKGALGFFHVYDETLSLIEHYRANPHIMPGWGNYWEKGF